MYIRLARRLLIGGLLALSAMIAVGAASWACVPGGGSSASGRKLAVDPVEAIPGESVTVATSLSAGAPPVEVRLNSAQGTLLAVLEAGAGGPVRATFNVPPETPPGRHALIAVQQGARWEPVLLAVAGPDGVVPDRELSDTGVNNDKQPWGLGVVGLGAVVVVAMAVTVSFRRRARARSTAPALEDSAAQDSVQHPTPAP